MNFDRYQGLGQALFEESEDALILFDPATRQVLDVNCAFQRLCGISLPDLLNAPVTELFRSNRREGLGSLTFRARKICLPYVEHGIQLRTSISGAWVSVDVAATQLAVRPWPLVLLTLRESHRITPSCGNPMRPALAGTLNS